MRRHLAANEKENVRDEYAFYVCLQNLSKETRETADQTQRSIPRRALSVASPVMQVCTTAWLKHTTAENARKQLKDDRSSSRKDIIELKCA